MAANASNFNARLQVLGQPKLQGEEEGDKL